MVSCPNKHLFKIQKKKKKLPLCVAFSLKYNCHPLTSPFSHSLWCSRCFPGGTVVKNLPAMQELQVQSLGQEDPLEKEMATHSNNFAWKIPWTEEPGVSPWGRRVRHS